MAIRNTAPKMSVLTTTAAIVAGTAASLLMIPPGVPSVPASTETVVVATTASPPMRMISTLRSRALIGFGRSLRGTAQAMFVAFCRACATPMAP